MKKILLLLGFCLMLAFPSSILSQSSQENFRFFGFVKYDLFFDSREMVAARQGQYSLFPAGRVFNENGNDINDNFSFHMLAIQTRLGVDITGPDAFGAKSRAFVEGAFFGNIESDINGFRLRHAFVELNWDNRHKIMMGQFWHPLFAERAVPGVVGVNTGAPFKPFARNPQVRYTFTSGKSSLILAALSQIDFASQGGTQSLRRSGIPNLHAQIHHGFGNLLTGVGADFKILKPMIQTAEETISSYALTAFANYSRDPVRFLMQATYGQNLFDHLMLGGFGVRESGVEYSLEAIETGAIWADFSFGQETRLGIFGGYSRNYGANNSITTPAGYRGSNVDHIWRVSPRIEWSSGPVRLSTEFEITAAAYGIPNAFGKVNVVETLTNYRFMFAAWYFF